MNHPGRAPSPGALSLSSRSTAISLMGAFSRIALSFECTLGPPTRLCLTLCTIDYSRYTWLSRGVDVVVIVDVHVNVYVHVHVYGRDESPRPSPEPRGALLELALSCDQLDGRIFENRPELRVHARTLWPQSVAPIRR